jgi:SAM-dependent methyltransferase
MSALRQLLGKALFRWGWDTRCRHAAPIVVLRDATRASTSGEASALLDVGCGDGGMAIFLKNTKVVGVDLEPSDAVLDNRTFVQASITELPFADSSFRYVTCIDVLQALPRDIRERGLAEMIRVAREGLVITAPQGGVAASVDADYQRGLIAHGKREPDWVAESLANPYPTAEAIVAALPDADVTVSYGERAAITRIVHAAAARSSLLYAVVNLFFGVLRPLVPAPSSANAYRVLVVARLETDAHG